MDGSLRLARSIKEDRKFYEYVLQVVLVYVVVIIALVNLSFGVGNADLWKYLLLTFVGFFLPSPTIKTSARDQLTASPSTPFPLNNFDYVPPNLVGDVPDSPKAGNTRTIPTALLSASPRLNGGGDTLNVT